MIIITQFITFIFSQLAGTVNPQQMTTTETYF